jgi:hypothetical protein
VSPLHFARRDRDGARRRSTMNHLILATSLLLGAALSAQAPTCTSTLAGLGCGAALHVTFTPVGAAGNHMVALHGTGMHPDSFGVMVWGVVPAAIEITPGCTMWTEFSWGHLINVDSLGEWSWSRSWPASAVPLYFTMQLGSFVLDPSGGFQLRATDAMRAGCQ